ncbi:hypothetical protein KW843_20130 [Acidovorax sp. sif1233]|jgi:hypothetical protein|uniref:hypothetical protein n=1 Tax=unclassified Acidovorax TaxID=2684926 RepID=UPI001C44BBDC|nr:MULTISPECIES: hypothetical protein [unclassified Acidovorax]MBV7430424.1 hypothetical protein [Acidovorax sp. sif0732]MBV7451817.1 hypothetical protein [Acidovorax sp. sif0715]MBV7456801.1 hypothetical protein [Acidovorax sp. sif1233]
MQLLDAIMLCVLVGLVGATVTAYRAGNERRDVRLLAGLAALWGAGTAAALAWS